METPLQESQKGGRVSKFVWCGKNRKQWSDWEQKNLRTGKYHRLCSRCLHHRQMNPYNALLDMRKIK